MTRILGNFELLMQQQLPDFRDYTPDIAALSETEVAWAAAAGVESRGRPYFRPAHVLAGVANVQCERFPGGHTIHLENPPAFAERLRRVLKELNSCRE